MQGPHGVGRLDLLRRFVAVALVAAAPLVAPRLALADTVAVVDCAPPPPIEKAIAVADLVFVGTVVSAANDGRSATVNVTEVWRGDVPTPVTVNGGANPANPGEDDRSFAVGTTYLFLPILSNGVLVDGVCSSTVPWSDDLAGFRPPDVGHPLAAAPAGPGPLDFLGSFAGPLAMAGLIGGGVVGFAFLVSRRRDS